MNETIQTLIDQLQDQNANTRSQAAVSLGRLGDAGAVDALVRVLCNDSQLNVQEDATWALVRIGSAAVPPLIEVLADGNPAMRHNAAHALGKIGDAGAVDALVQALSDDDPTVRLKAAFALGQIGDTRAVEPLLRLLDDSSKEVRWTVAEVVGQFGESAVMLVSGVLQHHDVEARELAASILGEIGDPRAVEPLVQALIDSEWQVRFAVVNALGDIGDNRAAGSLAPLLEDADSRVRSLTTRILKRWKNI